MSFRRIRSRRGDFVFKTEKARWGWRRCLEPLRQLEDRQARATLLVSSFAANVTNTQVIDIGPITAEFKDSLGGAQDH